MRKTLELVGNAAGVLGALLAVGAGVGRVAGFFSSGLNGFSRSQKCSGPISYFIESFSESSHDSPTKPYAR